MRLPLAFDFQRLFGNVVDFLHHLDGTGTGVIHGGHTKNPDGDLRQHHTARSVDLILYLSHGHQKIRALELQNRPGLLMDLFIRLR